MELGLQDRRALVTGGSGGIGREVALGLAREGARVALAARDLGALQATAEELRRAGARQVLTVPGDLAFPGVPEHAVEEAARVFGGLDVLVNNVGSARQVALDALSDLDWTHSFEINVLSAVRALRAALPHLRRSDQARVVNVSSTAGKRPSTGMPDYTVMKAALLSLSRLVADLEAANGVLCNAVTPGPVRTDAWLADGGLADQAARRSGRSREEALAAAAAGRPLGRMAEPDEIAAVVVFLCSARASYVTGAAWSVDGGTVPIII